ncbi:MAG: hypothetical protein IPP17_24090 [Bacteroidetes bacterium]|nr:hypothetical protein [Bacteroidota bacterium]
MSIYSPNAFLLGTMISAVLIFGGNVLNLLLCRLFKIGVLEFVTFYHRWLPLHSATVGGIKFILGWIPTGSSLKVFGMNMTEEERKQIPVEELPYAFFTKPKWVKILLQSVPFQLIGLLFLVVMTMQSGNRSLVETISAFHALVLDAFAAMFSDSITHDEFLIAAKSLLADNSPALFALTLFGVYWLLCLPLNWVMHAIAWGSEKPYRLLGVIGWLALLPTMWVLFWKIPKFVFSFFSWGEVFLHSGNVLVGVFVTGMVLHVLTLMVAKLSARGR